MAWCKQCGYGNRDYNFNHCGHCQATDMVEDDPFAEARKNPQTLSSARKEYEKNNKQGKGKGKKQDGSKMKEEIAGITRGDLKSRDYETFA